MKIQLIFDEQKRGDFDVNGPAEIYKALRAQNIRSEVLLFDRAIDMCFERKFDDAEIFRPRKIFLNVRLRRGDQNHPNVIKIGAILAIFGLFEVWELRIRSQIRSRIRPWIPP